MVEVVPVEMVLREVVVEELLEVLEQMELVVAVVPVVERLLEV
jgi:hypothetical protein